MFMFLQVCVPAAAETAVGPALAWVPGTFEWVIIGVVALVVFGPKKLPQIGQAVGKSLREFKQAADGIKDEFNEAAKTADKKTKPTSEGGYRSPYEGSPETHPDHTVDPYYQQGNAGTPEDQSEQHVDGDNTGDESPAQYPQPDMMTSVDRQIAEDEAASAAAAKDAVTAEPRKD